MPCYDERSSASYVHEHEVRPLRQERDKIQAMLCGIMKALHKNNLLIPILTQYDAKEAGIDYFGEANLVRAFIKTEWDV